MRLRIELVGILCLAAVVQPAVLSRAGTASPDAAFQQRLFGRVLSKTLSHACFRRVYDPSHLASHPEQNVQRMLLLVTGRQRETSTDVSYQLSLDVAFRKRGPHFTASGDCGPDAHSASAGQPSSVMHCGLDCDGGSIDVSLKDDESVRVVFPESGGAEAPHGPLPPDKETDRFGADDKTFHLAKAPLTDCLSFTDDPSEKSAMRRGE